MTEEQIDELIGRVLRDVGDLCDALRREHARAEELKNVAAHLGAAVEDLVNP